MTSSTLTLDNLGRRFPPPLAGKLTVSLRYARTGSASDGEELLRPMRTAAAPLADTVATLPCRSIGAIHADPVEPMPAHDEGDLLRSLPDQAIDGLMEVAGAGSGSPLSIVEFRQLGGALARPPAEPNMLCHRDAAYNLAVIGPMVPPVADVVPERAAAVRAALAPGRPAAPSPTSAPARVRTGWRAYTTRRRWPGSPSWPTSTTRRGCCGSARCRCAERRVSRACGRP